MRKILLIALAGLNRVRRERSTLVMMFVMPLFMTALMGMVFGNGGSGSQKIPVAVVDVDHSAYSQQAVTILKKENAYKVSLMDQAMAKDQVKNSKVLAAVLIPKGFGEALTGVGSAKVEVWAEANSPNGAVLSSITNGIVSRLAVDAVTADVTIQELKSRKKAGPDRAAIFAKADQGWEPPPFTVETKNVTTKSIEKRAVALTPLGASSMGMTLMFLGFTAFLAAGAFLEERRIGTWGRLLATPTAPWQILCGRLVYTVLSGIFQSILLIVACRFIFGVNWGNDIPTVLLIVSAYIFCLTGIGLFCATTVKTYAQLNGLTSILITATSMLGGLFWQRDMGSKIMADIGAWFPQAWAIDSLRAVINNGKDFSEVLPAIGLLIAVGIVFMAVGTKRVRFE